MDHNSTILIVDDTEDGRLLLKRLLEAEGYSLAFATDGIEALAKAAQLTPDLILLDVMMPNMNGFEVCQRMRADPLLSKVPIILITALDDRVSRLHGLELGADDFVVKPFDQGELLARVRSITQINRYRHLLLERAKFEWVVENTDDGYLVVNNDDDILYANRQARLYFGLTATEDEIISDTFLVLADKLYHFKPEAAWSNWPKLAEGQSPRYLMQPETPSTHAFWLQVDLFPAEPNRSWIVRMRDVTKQVTLQRDMRGFHELVSHKLLTPILGMQVGLETMARHAAKLSSEEVAEYANKALKNVERLQGQIQDVLQYLNSRHLTRPTEKFNLTQLQLVATNAALDLELKTIKVLIEPELEETRLSLSRQAVELILKETLENARKFHPQESPKVEISVSRLGERKLSVKITDDGVTLAPEQLAQAWTPYYQGEKDFTGEVTGMGLGLSLVATLVWEAGGTPRLYNREDGPGVIVELVLPLVENDDSANEY